MADRPIIFSAPMVRALLAGRKTQTRRIAKVRPGLTLQDLIDGGERIGEGIAATREMLAPVRYAVGDRLYVREQLWVVGDGIRFAAHDADDYCFDAVENHAYHPGRDLWVRRVANKAVGIPSIHMPRWASRLTLIVDDVRVERLQSISEADAIAEGCVAEKFPGPWWQGYKDLGDGDLIHQQAIGETPPDWMIDPKPMKATPWLDRSARDDFRLLWINLHDLASWTANPFVVALTFRVVPGNIDRVEGGSHG